MVRLSSTEAIAITTGSPSGYDAIAADPLSKMHAPLGKAMTRWSPTDQYCTRVRALRPTHCCSSHRRRRCCYRCCCCYQLVDAFCADHLPSGRHPWSPAPKQRRENRGSMSTVFGQRKERAARKPSHWLSGCGCAGRFMRPLHRVVVSQTSAPFPSRCHWPCVWKNISRIARHTRVPAANTENRKYQCMYIRLREVTFCISLAAFFWLRFEFSMIRVISSFCILAWRKITCARRVRSVRSQIIWRRTKTSTTDATDLICIFP